MSKLTRWSPLALLALLLFLGLVVPRLTSSPCQATAAQEGDYVGMDQCVSCHEEEVAALKETNHGKKGFEMRSTRACETCHGPGKAHVDSGGSKGTIKNPAKLPKDEKTAICLGCHSRGTKLMWEGSPHDTTTIGCEDCHSVHKPKTEKAQLKAESEPELCFACHKQKKSQFLRASHHPIREGKMECSSCHNPHGSAAEKLITADSVNDKCFECHAEKRGPFLWEHVPVREDCLNCHDPHGTNHPKMLTVREPFLCQRCHSDTRHPGTLYDQSAINSANSRIINRSCSNCHQNIHGSNHPSGQFFLR